MGTEKSKGSFWQNCMFGYIPAGYFVVMLALLLLSFLFQVNAPGFLGGFTICSILGLLLMKIGDNTPFVKTYLGGGGFVAIFGAAAVAYLNVLPESSTALLVSFVKDMDYIGWVVAALICGSILTMDRKLLIKAGIRYLPAVLGAIAAAFALAGLFGMISGFGWRQAILFVALPIMGGGTSAGAVPTSETYGKLLSMGSDYYLSLLMPAVIIGNAISVIAAGILNSVGKKVPSMSGNGILMKGFSLKENSFDKEPITIDSLGRGFLLTGCFFLVGILLAQVMPQLHYYAWTIIACAVCKIFDLLPMQLQIDLNKWNSFMMKVGAGPAVYFAIGYVYTDLGIVFDHMSAAYLIMALLTVIGAILGAGFVGWLMGFFPIEAAVTAGLCMSNMGGSGDIAVLGAADRMGLMPFAQISSRIGGAIIILLASILPLIIGSGL